jgi:hypothetical protein
MERVPTTRELVAQRKTTEVAAPNGRSYTAAYLDEIAPGGIAGRLIKFSKGAFITADDEVRVPEDVEFIVLADQSQCGWIKFGAEGEAPECHMGLLYDGFRVPPRETLGDLDQAKWPEGLSGKPEDPWLHQISIVLQRLDTSELFTFSTSSVTGRRACGTILKHYDRTRARGSEELPLVKLKVGSFDHRDSRVGKVMVPVFQVCGRAPIEYAVKPVELDDEVPF